MAPASALLPLIRFRDPWRSRFNSSNRDRAYWPRTLVSMTNRAAIHSITSSAIG
jgi:hypothetical protein